MLRNMVDATNLAAPGLGAVADAPLSTPAGRAVAADTASAEPRACEDATAATEAAVLTVRASLTTAWVEGGRHAGRDIPDGSIPCVTLTCEAPHFWLDALINADGEVYRLDGAPADLAALLTELAQEHADNARTGPDRAEYRLDADGTWTALDAEAVAA